MEGNDMEDPDKPRTPLELLDEARNMIEQYNYGMADGLIQMAIEMLEIKAGEELGRKMKEICKVCKKELTEKSINKSQCDGWHLVKHPDCGGSGKKKE